MTRKPVPLWATETPLPRPMPAVRVRSGFLAQVIRDLMPQAEHGGPVAGRMVSAAFQQRKKGAPEWHARVLDKAV